MTSPRFSLDEVVSDQFPLKELLARILRLLHRHTSESIHNRVIWLQDFRR
jgi:hypothetical protein